MKRAVIFFCLISLVLVTAVACILHFYKLDQIPYGFHVDELSGAVTVGCMATEGTDGHGRRYPLFADLRYGTPKPPTYLYPAAVWSKIAGYSVPSLRAFSVAVHIIGMIGLFFLARLLFGIRFALVTIAVASVSPWVWVSSRVAIEPLFSPTFLIWGIYLLLKPARAWTMVLAGALLAFAMYSYPPARMQAPLMLLSLFLYIRSRNKLTWRPVTIFVISLGVLLIPLAQAMLKGNIQQRFNTISIFSTEYLESVDKAGSLKDLTGIFINNYRLHLTPDFLFRRGDPSLVHSTLHFGILSWMDMAALVLGAVFLLMFVMRKFREGNPFLTQRYFILFLFVNIAIGIIPSALTNSELPNSLRIVGSWPFMCLLTGFLIWQACERVWILWPATVLATILFAFVFLKFYFEVYPHQSRGMFSFWTLEEANQLKTPEDWTRFLVRNRYQDYHYRYFAMQYRGDSCSQSEKTWDAMRAFLTFKGQY